MCGNSETEFKYRVKKRQLRILCIHPNVELYGSDRSFVQTVAAIKEGWPDAHVRVLLSGNGPLNPVIAEVADELIVRSQCVMRKAVLGQTLAKLTIGMPYYLVRGLMDMVWADFVYINTVVDAGHLIAARGVSKRVAIHVREIPTGRAAAIFRSFCAIAGGRLIFNSQATADAFTYNSDQRGAVIHNGVDPADDAAAPVLPAAFTPERPLRLLMLGRINDWKGQDLLIEALSRLPQELRALVSLRIVGSTYMGVSEPIEALKRQIDAAGLQAQVTLEPFSNETDDLYRWSDISLVPSRQPEPFGRVAIEAMAHARPVIAADHGGLTEIVDSGRSGWLFTPNDADALADVIRTALAAPSLIATCGAQALSRFDAHFSTQTMSARLQSLLRHWIPALASR